MNMTIRIMAGTALILSMGVVQSRAGVVLAGESEQEHQYVYKAIGDRELKVDLLYPDDWKPTDRLKRPISGSEQGVHVQGQEAGGQGRNGRGRGAAARVLQSIALDGKDGGERGQVSGVAWIPWRRAARRAPVIEGTAIAGRPRA